MRANQDPSSAVIVEPPSSVFPSEILLTVASGRSLYEDNNSPNPGQPMSILVQSETSHIHDIAMILEKCSPQQTKRRRGGKNGNYPRGACRWLVA